MKLSVLIPVFNEAGSIEEIVSRVAAVPLETEIILVDDGSTDSTPKVLANIARENVKVVTHPVNRGKGAAVRTALAAATGDVVVIQDADLEYDPADFGRMVDAMQSSPSKVVYGVRQLGDQDAMRRLGNRFLTLVTNLLYGASLGDMETCYKMIDRALLESLKLRADRFEIEVEITAKLLKAGHRIVEVPISYHPRRDRKLVPWIDGPHGLWSLVKHRFTD